LEYYFTDKNNIRKDTLLIINEEAEHLFKVLRRKEGQELYVTDGEYSVYKCEIIKAGKYEISCSITDRYYKLNEPDIKITLYPALLRNHDRFEFIIEKAVELGVHEIYPVITDRVLNKEWNKRDRWQSIAMSAMKQSQRCYLPFINEPSEFVDLINRLNENSVNIIGHENENKSRNLNELIKSVSYNNECSVFTGPEGGFSPEEILLAEKNKFSFIKLGNRKMRSETAAIVLSSLFLFR
jgi:16S rRNA (uracil1498-N3)-methyltransferase